MKKEILVIEGSKAMRFLLHTVLKKHYKVVSVADGMNAMFYLRQSASPDMIILDPEIADMPEWQLVKQLSLNSFYQNIPIIAISSADIDYTASQAMKYGVMETFTKPFNPSTLVETIDLMLIGNKIHKV